MSRLKIKRISLLLLIIYAVSMLVTNNVYAATGGCEFQQAIADGEIYSGIESQGAVCKNSDIKVSSRIYELLFGKEKGKTGELYLIPGGDAFGIRLNEANVTVSGVKEASPFKRGDKILTVCGVKINNTGDISRALEDCRGGAVQIEILRSGEKMTLTLTPKYENGAYRLGVTLRQVACGIGTITFIDPETGAFGGLGHGVCESESGKPVDISSGEASGVVLGAITRGEVGKPGELSGVLNKRLVGSISKNCECGVFGVLEPSCFSDRTPIPVANKNELKPGEAEIICTVRNGKTARYKIEINDIDISSTGSKSFKIKVTDPMLIALTGGIVRGMSGSPIIQNGKLVGAVTHVMVANPTEGYGIFIENMLNAAENTVPKAA